MNMKFEELDETTRSYMLAEFEAEESAGRPYRGRDLSKMGRVAFPDLMREAIRSGDEHSLTALLSNPAYWNTTETYFRNGVLHERRINVPHAAERLGLTEFNTWYVRGLAKRLMDEGFTRCQCYRAAIPKWEHGECSVHDGQVFSVEEIYRGHRARYWPQPGNPSAVSIPAGPNCHHTIRRIQ